MADCLNTPIHYVLLCFVMASVPLYLVVLYVIITRRKVVPAFRKFFFQISVGMGMADLAQLVAFAVAFKIPLQGWFRWTYLENPWIFKYAILSQWYLYRTQQLYVMALSFNRFTAVVFPLLHASIWHNKLKIITIVVWVLPLIYHVPMWTTDSWFGIELGNNSVIGWVVADNDLQIMGVYSTVDLLYNLLRAVCLTALYAVVFGVSWMNSVKVAPTNHSPANAGLRVELRLACIGFAIVLLEVGGVAYYIYLIFGYSSNICDILLFSQFGIETYSAINPWLMFIFCAKIRESVKHLFKRSASD